MRIEYFSKRNAEKIKPQDNIALISIRDKHRPTRLREGWKNLLAIEFDDIDPNELKVAFPYDGERMLKSYKLFSDFDSISIKNFVENLPSNVDTIYIHCHAGRSRSPSVAMAIAEKLNAKFERSADINPNLFVYDKLKSILG